MTYPKDIKIAALEQFALLNDPDFLNQAVTRFLQQLFEAEITSFLQAEPYQRTSLHTGYRNGYKPRNVKTRVGRIEFSVPQDREGRFLSELFARFQHSEKALILALQEAYLQGVCLHTQSDKDHRSLVWYILFKVLGLDQLDVPGFGSSERLAQTLWQVQTGALQLANP
ncbi:MAG: hypothetical protein F4W91_12390 [Gemmatimonadetes bacterium]|nr:hypothetical protein [Gemmatimonadota bacterium]